LVRVRFAEETLAAMRNLTIGRVPATIATGAVAAAERFVDSELAGVTAGFYDIGFIVPITIVINSSEPAAVGIHAESVTWEAEANVRGTTPIGARTIPV
jgi:hypothetical protein